MELHKYKQLAVCTVEAVTVVCRDYTCILLVVVCILPQEASCCYWPEEVGEAVEYGKLRVKLQLVTSQGDIVVRKMEVVEDTPRPEQAKPVKALSVTLMQLTSWPEQELPHPTAILSLIGHLTNAQMSSSTKRTVVMCRFVCI